MECGISYAAFDPSGANGQAKVPAVRRTRRHPRPSDRFARIQSGEGIAALHRRTSVRRTQKHRGEEAPDSLRLAEKQTDRGEAREADLQRAVADRDRLADGRAAEVDGLGLAGAEAVGEMGAAWSVAPCLFP